MWAQDMSVQIRDTDPVDPTDPTDLLSGPYSVAHTLRSTLCWLCWIVPSSPPDVSTPISLFRSRARPHLLEEVRHGCPGQDDKTPYYLADS